MPAYQLGGRSRYGSRDHGRGGARNGYIDGRVRSAEGDISVRVSQVRDAGGPIRSTHHDLDRVVELVTERLSANATEPSTSK